MNSYEKKEEFQRRNPKAIGQRRRIPKRHT